MGHELAERRAVESAVLSVERSGSLKAGVLVASKVSRMVADLVFSMVASLVVLLEHETAAKSEVSLV